MDLAGLQAAAELRHMEDAGCIFTAKMHLSLKNCVNTVKKYSSEYFLLKYFY